MLTKLQQMKIAFYRKQFPTINDAESALQLAIGKERLDDMHGDGSHFLLHESLQLQAFAELLEIEKNAK